MKPIQRETVTSARRVEVELLPTAEQGYLGWNCTPVEVRLPTSVDVGAGSAAMRKGEGGQRVLRLHLPR